jgi:DNA polymerase-3 subunit epsilon
MTNRNLTIVDVETTGGSPLFHRVIEVGILRVERGEVVEKYKSLVNPGLSIPEFISDMTGITDKMVKRAPVFEDVVEEIFPLFEDSIFVAHNSSFDYHFLKAEFERSGYKFSMDTLCTVRLSRVLFPKYKRHNLSAIIDRFDFKCNNRHRAFDDAKVLWDFLQMAEKEFPKELLNAALERTIKKISPSKQKNLPKILIPDVLYVEESF